MTTETNEGLNLAPGRSEGGEEAILRQAIEILNKNTLAAFDHWREGHAHGESDWLQLGTASSEAACQISRFLRMGSLPVPTADGQQ